MAGKPPPSPPVHAGERRLRRSPWRTSSRTQARLEKRTLRWVNIDRIGQQLFKEYPEKNPEPLSDADLLHLIISLPSFCDTPHPPNGMYVDLVREAWIDLKHPDETTTRTADPTA